MPQTRHRARSSCSDAILPVAQLAILRHRKEEDTCIESLTAPISPLHSHSHLVLNEPCLLVKFPSLGTILGMMKQEKGKREKKMISSLCLLNFSYGGSRHFTHRLPRVCFRLLDRRRSRTHVSQGVRFRARMGFTRKQTMEYVELLSAGALNCSAVASNLPCVCTDTRARVRVSVRIQARYAAIHTCARTTVSLTHLYAASIELHDDRNF